MQLNSLYHDQTKRRSSRLGYRWSPLGWLARCFSFPAGRSALATRTRTGNRGTAPDRSCETRDRAGEMR
jgi:hypothetical protein